jgi:hypothetical protein
MAETAIATTEQKNEMKERAHEANVMRRAMLGEIPWLSKEVAKPVVVAGAGGGLPQTRTKSRLEIGKRKENTTKN